MTYARSGVDIDMKSQAIAALVKQLRFRRTEMPKMIDIPGQFTGLIDFGEVVLTLATDGVGTKLLLASAMDKWDTVGIDCVAMNVNDTICAGAEPIAFVDYLAVDNPNPKQLEQIGIGLNKGCELANCDLVGGEVAVLPEIMKEIDLSGSCLGLVSKDRLIDGSKIKQGDAIIGLPSSGIHSNGLTLARKVLEMGGIPLDEQFSSLNGSIGMELLTPTEIYVRKIISLMAKCNIHGMVNVTGGGLRNFLRLRKGMGAVIDDPLPSQPVFDILSELGGISIEEQYQTFNMGMGFAIILPEDEASKAIDICGNGAKIIGQVVNDYGVSVPTFDIRYDRY
ncbi:MAG: phosphoribosylformylglycinamidine cyclo-ligase [Euryarchaeota archaeon]|nr:phosphoribosylformylglycinamidine cyclo-ligase [Euryarchaeota archaeon]